jgi:hypothetical protein
VRCNRQHRTMTCTTTDPKDFKCTNCTGEEAKGHGAADRNCPTFIKEKEKMQEHFPENKYKYFPSSLPRTWCLLNQLEQHTTEQQHMWQQRPNWNDTNNNHQLWQFTDQWQTIQCRQGYQPRPPLETQRGRGPTRRSEANKGASNNGWPTKLVQSTLDTFLKPSQTRNTQDQRQQEHQNTPWGDCEPNKQGPDPTLGE